MLGGGDAPSSLKLKTQFCVNGQKLSVVGEINVLTSEARTLKRYLQSVSLILFVTGIAKVWIVFGNAGWFGVVEPFVGIKVWQLMLAVGWGEIGIALVCLFTKRQTPALGLVAWISTNFVLYRLGLWWMDWKKPCSCLGNLTDALHIPPQLADNIMKVVLAYLLIGSYGLLFWQWRRRKQLIVAS